MAGSGNEQALRAYLLRLKASETIVRVTRVLTQIPHVLKVPGNFPFRARAP